jgi:beta-glucosidase
MKKIAIPCLAFFATACAIPVDVHAQATPKYLDPSQPIETRITDLLPRLTLDEKVLQLSDSWGSKGIPRLKVPAMLKTEGLHGQSYSTGATIFPQAIMMGSVFDTTLIRKVGRLTALEAKAANLRNSWSPVLDVARDARWGRVEETYGEDPYLVARTGVAWINGFQGENMIAVPKHFAGHGEPLGGRDSHDAGLSDRIMRTIHLLPFRAVIKEAHAGGVMAAYSTWNGVPDNGSTELLQKILREEWGFDGIVVSDCSGPENFFRKQSVVNNLDEAARMSILGGVDIECGSVNASTLANAVQKGILKESDLDANLRRVFRTKYKLGLFEHPSIDKMVWEKLPAYDIPEHRALAREIAVKGSVLLKNDKRLLPLQKDIKTIAVIGPNANTAQTGDYSAKADSNQLVTVLQGVKSHVSAQTNVLYARGCGTQSLDSSGFAQAVEAASKSDVVVMVVGDYSTRENVAEGEKEKATTGENVDGATLEIPGVQRQLIKRIAATGKPIVLVLVNGKPFTLSWEAENIAAILETWYPGEEGGNATADIIFGDANPSGRLPITFPRHVGQLPLRYNYEPSGRNYNYYDMPFTPLYRFGHGLSYTSFSYSNLKVTTKKDDPGFATVTVDVQNTGDRAGEEVAQLYLTDVVASVITPVIELQGFNRVALEKGEKKTVRFELNPYQLSLLNADMERVVEPGKFRIHVGGVSPEPPAGNAEHKQKIGFTNPAQGISGEFEVPVVYQANFVITVKAPAAAKGGESIPVTVTVKNTGNLVDVADIRLYGETLLDDYRPEIDPGQTVTHTFNVALYKGGTQPLMVVVGKKTAATSVAVSKAPAKLVLDNIRTSISDDGVLHYEALAANTGSLPYTGSFGVLVNDKTAVAEPLKLEAGEKRTVKINYAFPRSGAYRVRIGNAPEQRMVVPGGIGLALQNPLLYLNFEEGSATAVKDAVNNTTLAVKGSGKLVDGKNGKAFYSGEKQTFIAAGGLDLYRKSFTLASWVNIEKYDGGGQAMFFGGQAPMGADVDNTGTGLAVGTLGENPLLSFQERDVKGNGKVPTGQWVHVAYTYNAENNIGTVYINGKVDKSAAQKPYAGPFDMIGSSQRFNHGRFAMDEVLATRSCLTPDNIKELAAKGVESLRKGQVTTDWRTVTTTLTQLQSLTEMPANSSIQVIVENGDKDGKVISSKTITLKNGEQIIPLEGLAAGDKVRLRIELSSPDWTTLPALQSVILSGKNSESIRWSTTGEWKKGTVSGGLKIGL